MTGLTLDQALKLKSGDVLVCIEEDKPQLILGKKYTFQRLANENRSLHIKEDYFYWGIKRFAKVSVKKKIG